MVVFEQLAVWIVSQNKIPILYQLIPHFSRALILWNNLVFANDVWFRLMFNCRTTGNEIAFEFLFCFYVSVDKYNRLQFNTQIDQACYPHYFVDLFEQQQSYFLFILFIVTILFKSASFNTVKICKENLVCL